MSAYLSWRSQRKSKSERDEATAQAERAERAAGAAERQANAAERSAAAVEAQARREAEELEAAEADPWELAPIPGGRDCYLINTSNTVKYNVTVEGFKLHDGPARFDMIGPGKREELSIMRIGHPDDTVKVTWRQRPDLSDSLQTRTKTIPSRI
ncbi:hypothetical protein BN000_01475 [Mycobacterium europaeum]|uniref:Uncharacterized protein n=1 Tax=Mycobacterium europaeum TaxID=761804 RepID=A0A0U1D3B2_9MYCO|nr:hypothetical protein BN000_01475 [Mycobacterium europaeum]